MTKEEWWFALNAFSMNAAEARQAELTQDFAEMKADEFFKKFGKVEDRRIGG